MTKIIEVNCKYCGAFIDISKAVKINLETGEYEYLCDNCAIKWGVKKDNQLQYVDPIADPKENQ